MARDGANARSLRDRAGPAARRAALAAAGLAALRLAAGCDSNVAGTAVKIEPAGLYSQMCARCHGPDGRGDPEMRKLMPVKDFGDPLWQRGARLEELERVIMAGKNQMPAFGGALSQPKIQHLAGYVKRLGSKP
jgi:mono/diheme cytochrome c family protein